jgi:hypothetical protein
MPAAVPQWAVPLRMLSIDINASTLEKHFVFSERALKNGRYWTL